MSALEFVYVEEEPLLRRCHPLLAELRPQLDSADTLLACWRRQLAEGYRLLALLDAGTPVAIAGYRIQHNLIHGRFLYVDDLVTATARRREGLGARMLGRLQEEARQHECQRLLLDTPMSNALGHRFYFRQGLLAGALRFNLQLDAA